MRVVVLLFCASALGGCASKGLLGTEPDAARQMPTSHVQAIGKHLERTLKDPDSVKALSIGEPERSSCLVGIYGRYHAWRIPVSYNAKNSFGAYVGLRQKYYWFQGENLRGITEDPGLCAEAGGWYRQ